jgi:Ca-activated chloride channel homolog
MGRDGCAEQTRSTGKFEEKFGLRNMKSLRKIAVLAVATMLCAPDAWLGAQASAQTPASAPPSASPRTLPQTGAPAKIVIPVNQVIVPVTVKDRAGNIIADLHRDEFRIFEDKVEQRISAFTAEAYPLSMVVLLDNDLKSKDAEQVAASLRSVIAGMSASDEAFICKFDQFFHPGKGFTTDQDKLMTELKRTALDEEPSVASPSPAISDGPTINGHSAMGDAPSIAGATNNIKGQPTKALDDAVYEAAQLLKDRGRDRRKLIILISDGVNGTKFNKNKYENVVKDLLKYEVSVYSVAVSSAYFNRKFSHLIEYAHATGGDVYFAAKRETMEELYSRIAEQARNEYTLAYSPSGTDRSAEYHAIEVRVERAGLNVTAREGYFAGGVPH